jgi:hypothetical protein
VDYSGRQDLSSAILRLVSIVPSLPHTQKYKKNLGSTTGTRMVVMTFWGWAIPLEIQWIIHSLHSTASIVKAGRVTCTWIVPAAVLALSLLFSAPLPHCQKILFSVASDTSRQPETPLITNPTHAVSQLCLTRSMMLYTFRSATTLRSEGSQMYFRNMDVVRVTISFFRLYVI